MKIFTLIFLVFLTFFAAQAQTVEREFPYQNGATVEIKNLYGRVFVLADEKLENKAIVQINADKSLTSSEIRTETGKGLNLEILPQNVKNRVDLTIKLPLRARVRITTGEGEVRVSGNLESAEVFTETGTIAAQVPLDDLKYNFLWTASRPRVLSDPTLEEIKEKSAGKFQIKGKISGQSSVVGGQKDEEDSKTEDQKPKTIELNLTTARGIILLNVNPNEVPSDLRERTLTNAAKAIIRSGDSLLMEAIRRASPKYFGDYAATLPPIKRTPNLTLGEKPQPLPKANLKQVLVKVTDLNNRAVADLKQADFEVSESGKEREIVSVVPTTAPFNLVLLLDVSGSVENYVDFIRKAARDFVNTAGANDKIAIIIFNEDVKTISTFTTDKGKLSESLDTFDAGGSTAYYDALAFTLVETLRPLRGERTAIIALTDGDDNRSFLPFDSLLGSIQESGALIYPLYVPSELIAATANNNPNRSIDTLRTRYMGLTSRAESEGEKLAQISGGVYYPIRQLGDLQKAYDDIVIQLRTAYTITFRSDLVEETNKITASPRLKVRVKRPNSFVKLGSVVSVDASSENYFPQRRKEREDEFFYFANFTPFRETPSISADIAKINYKQFVNDNLKTSKLDAFDINKSQGAFLLSNDKETIAVSRWISPKRTRSYPYERVYDTLAHNGKKVTIIPVVKDEGLGGERDFLQWDTLSLLSLLDVHVVLAYYDSAEKNTKRGDQITLQKFENNYINSRLKEIFEFKGTAREWNEREAKQLKTMFEKAKSAYAQISKQTQTYLHDSTALDELIKYAETPQKFIEFSRSKSEKAQDREFVTDQPKEALSTDTKAKVTINNALFGKYFFTCDETKIEEQTVYLIEAKHSQRAKFPSKNDIKDGLIKMMLYTNLQNVRVGTKKSNLKVQIRLTSNQLKGSTNSDAKTEEIDKFFTENSFNSADKTFFQKLFTEARENKFTIILEHAETAK